MFKDCTTCINSEKPEECYADANCWCSLMEIHIFNPSPYFCSSYENREGKTSLFEELSRSVGDMAEHLVYSYWDNSGKGEWCSACEGLRTMRWKTREEALKATIEKLNKTFYLEESKNGTSC